MFLTCSAKYNHEVSKNHTQVNKKSSNVVFLQTALNT